MIECRSIGMPDSRWRLLRAPLPAPAMVSWWLRSGLAELKVGAGFQLCRTGLQSSQASKFAAPELEADKFGQNVGATASLVSQSLSPSAHRRANHRAGKCQRGRTRLPL